MLSQVEHKTSFITSRPGRFIYLFFLFCYETNFMPQVNRDKVILLFNLTSTYSEDFLNIDFV